MLTKVNKMSKALPASPVKNKILHAPKMLFAKTQTSKQALILFTRLPIAGKTKTRLIPYLGKKGARDIHLALLQDFAKLYRNFHRREKEVKLFLFFSSATANEVVEGAFDPGKKESTKEQEERKEERYPPFRSIFPACRSRYPFSLSYILSLLITKISVFFFLIRKISAFSAFFLQ